MELVDGGHLEFWYLDSSKYKNDVRNGLSMLHLVGKVILHGFLWPFTFKLHFQYGHRRPSWSLMVGLGKIQNRCQKLILHAKISRKSGITQLSKSICFQFTFPIWPPAAILDFGFSQIPPPFSRGSWELNFFEILQSAQTKRQTLLCSQWSRDPQIAPNYLIHWSWGNRVIAQAPWRVLKRYGCNRPVSCHIILRQSIGFEWSVWTSLKLDDSCDLYNKPGYSMPLDVV